jgi:hypothetical protein
MTRERALGILAWSFALVFLAVGIGRFSQLMSARWSVAYLGMVAIVLAVEILARTVFKRYLSQHQALDTVLDIAVMAALFVASLIFFERCYPGPS